MKRRHVLLVVAAAATMFSFARAGTVALWLIDEPEGIYPSSLLKDASENNYFLVLGRGAEIVPGRFSHALHPAAPAPLLPKIKGKPASQLQANDLGVEPGMRGISLYALQFVPK